uniref:Nucleoporin 160 n=1 Tax=Oncorhynchus kisutch TaxID=8019 RepID=A0A8C7N882_ONCKI
MAIASKVLRTSISVNSLKERPKQFETVMCGFSTGLNALPGSVIYPDSTGGFHCEGSGKLLSITSNRFLHWSTSGDTVQLVEQSLDTNLLNSAVKLKITHCPLLPGGVHIQETLNNVTLLIVTNQTVHRLVLPHPTCMYCSELVTELQMQSIFADVGKMSLQDPAQSGVIPSPVGQTVGPTASAAWLSHQGEAHYALASPAGVVTLPPHDTQAGWLDANCHQVSGDLALSLAVRELEDDTFILALCQYHKLRMWSYRDQACLMEADMLEYMPGHRLRLAFSSTGLCLAIYLAVPSRGQFTVLQLVATDNNCYSLDHISSLFETLVDFALTSTDIWGLWLDDTNQTVVKYINFEHSTAGQWNQVFVQPGPEEKVHIGADQDPRETYLDMLFSPLRFTASAIVKALQIYRRGTERITDLPWETLKKEVTVAVEKELQSSVTEFEFSQEEYRQLQVEFRSKFYACCLQYQEGLATPLGLLLNPHTHIVCVLKKGFVSFLVPCFAVEHLYLYFDEYLFSDRDVLVQCLRLVSDTVPGDMAYKMEKALEHLQSPERARAEMVLENLLANKKSVRNVIEDIHNKLQDVHNPLAAMAVLIREMELETDSEPWLIYSTSQSLSWRISLSQLYGSSVAVAVVCQAVCQMAMTRALFCRDLLILQQLYLRLGDNVSRPQLLQLQQDLIPRSSQLLSSSYLLKHITQSLTTTVPLDFMYARTQTHTFHRNTTHVRSPQTVVELFYQSIARKAIITQIYSKQHSPAPLAPHGLQHGQSAGSATVSYHTHRTALQCFKEAAAEVEREEFLLRLTGAEDEAAAAPRLQYHNKVLRLLEDVGLPELVIHLATLAITEAVNDPRSQAALWTRIFKHHLDLGHNSQAYEALTQNPDSSSQLDCLRQLVVVLCERSQLQDLVQFSYVNLHDEVDTHTHHRARAVDLMSHNYYELLYAFHINRHNYREAGRVMFEYGMRLGREVRTQLAVYERPAASPKRNYDGEFTTGPVSGQIDILELKDLQKEYALARSRLAQHHPPSAAIAGSASAVEMVSLLVQSGLFDCALSLCQTFKLSLTSVFKGLAFQVTGSVRAESTAWSDLNLYAYLSLTMHEVSVPNVLYTRCTSLPMFMMSLSATAPLVWLPYTSIDQLLQSLTETQNNARKLQDKLNDYHKLVDQTTRRRLQAQ